MPGGEIQIGETTIVFQDDALPTNRNATLIADHTEALDPSKTIAFTRRNPTSEFLQAQYTTRNDLVGLISKVGIALLSSSGLEETLKPGRIAGF